MVAGTTLPSSSCCPPGHPKPLLALRYDPGSVERQQAYFVTTPPPSCHACPINYLTGVIVGLFTKKPKAPKEAPIDMPTYVKLPSDGVYEYRVSGVMNYQDNLRSIISNIPRKNYRDGWLTAWANLVPEPDNSFDGNAIKIVFDGHHVGYIPARDTHVFHRAIESNGVDFLAIAIKLRWRPDIPDTNVGVVLGWDPFVEYN
jgi:hypothetical protein